MKPWEEYQTGSPSEREAGASAPVPGVSLLRGVEPPPWELYARPPAPPLPQPPGAGAPTRPAVQEAGVPLPRLGRDEEGIDYNAPAPPVPLVPGNIDLSSRPRVQNADGTTSTIRSISIGTDQGEVLIPTLADDGRQLTEEEAIEQYKRTGKHLGIFANRNAADMFAKQLSEAQGQPREEPYAIQRGFVSTLEEQNPRLLSSFLEMVSDDLPVGLQSKAEALSKELKEAAKLPGPEYKKKIEDISQIGGISDVLTFVGESVGQGPASAIPVLVGGLAGAATGQVALGPVGAVAGGVTGAFGSSYALAAGEVYESLRQEGVDREVAKWWAYRAGVPIALLDMALLGTVAGKSAGALRGTAVNAVKKGILGWIKDTGKEVVKTSAIEGGTEGIQAGIERATVSAATGKPFATEENARGIITEALAGAFGGAPFGVVSPTLERFAAVRDDTDNSEVGLGGPIAENVLSEVYEDVVRGREGEVSPTLAASVEGVEGGERPKEVLSEIERALREEGPIRESILQKVGRKRERFGEVLEGANGESYLLVTERAKKERSDTASPLWIDYENRVDPETGGFVTEVSFGGTSRTTPLGLKEGAARLATVAESVRDFIRDFQPRSIWWTSAAPQLDPLYERVARSIAKEFGGRLVDEGVTKRIHFDNYTRYVKLPESATEKKASFSALKSDPLVVFDTRPFVEDFEPAVEVGPGRTPRASAEAQIATAKRIVGIGVAIARKLGIEVPILVRLHNKPIFDPLRGSQGSDGYYIALREVPSPDNPRPGGIFMSEFDEVSGAYFLRDSSVAKAIEIGLNIKDASPVDIYTLIMHELGHAVFEFMFAKAPTEVKVAINAAYAEWLAKHEKRKAERGVDLIDYTRTSRNFPLVLKLEETGAHNTPAFLTDPGFFEYWVSMSEWMAEQVARWATTDMKPLGMVEEFFHAVATRLKLLVQRFIARFPALRERYGELTDDERGLPAAVVKSWLDSLWAQRHVSTAALLSHTANIEGMRVNQHAMERVGVKDFPASSMTTGTIYGRAALQKLFPGKSMPPEIEATAAAADYWHTSFKWMVDLAQLADKNPHVTSLQRYRDLVMESLRFANQWFKRAEDTLTLGYRMAERELRAYTKLVDSYINMLYLSEEERKAGVERRPTREEFIKLVKDSKASEAVVRFFQRTVKDYDDFASALFDEVRRQIGELPIEEQAAELNAVDAVEQAWRQKPYAPALRYGKFAINVYDREGNTIGFYRFETRRQQMRNLRLIERTLDKSKGEWAQVSILPESVMPFIGLPPRLIELIEKRLNLSDEQRAALKQLKFELSPMSSFAHRFQKRTLMPGYSTDFLRGYAHYFFHGARYLARVKYADQLRREVDQARFSVKTALDGNKRSEIAEFMAQHLEKRFLNPRPDWAIFRTIAFYMFIAGKAAAASLNLSQTFIGTYPLLAKDFGDGKAAKAIAETAKRFRNFYTERAVMASTAAEDRALAEGLRLEDIKTAFALDLAGLSEGRNLLRGFGGNAAQRAANSALKASAYLFALTEQTNRRVAFLAAWRLAMDDTANPKVTQAVQMWRRVYDDLRKRGFNHQEASAITYAHQMTRVTQGDYTTYARARFMTGPGSAIFALRTFQHKMLYNMMAFPTAGIRMALVFGFLGGLMGLPLAEDFGSLLKAIAWRLFGRDFDLEREARALAKEYLTAPFGKYAPDYFARGIASRGYGIPDLLDYIGEKVGYEDVPFPVIDRSRAVGLGPILPVDVGALWGPKRNTERDLGEIARAGGVFGGYFYNVIRFFNDPTDPKAFERILPAAFSYPFKAIRIGLQGGEVNSRGNIVVRFDPYDVRDLTELVGLALGYQPARLSQTWNKIVAQAEADTYWDARRAILLDQAWVAFQTKQRGDREDWDRVVKEIRDFNNQLRKVPELRPRVITRKTMERSFKSRMMWKKAQESGVPAVKSDRPLAEQIQQLYPSAEIETRPERVPAEAR